VIETVELNDKQRKSRRGRNIALGIVLAALVVIFYVVTIIKIGNVG
jgi:t-SNARE complex subunit (syntaxin)